MKFTVSCLECLTISILIPVHKKGSVSDTKNYGGLALMSVTAKLCNRILFIRIRNGLDASLTYHQNGFRSERATSQHVLAARRIFEEMKDSPEGKLVAIFIGFSTAFDYIANRVGITTRIRILQNI
jgi:hypothetical protein